MKKLKVKSIENEEIVTKITMRKTIVTKVIMTIIIIIIMRIRRIKIGNHIKNIKMLKQNKKCLLKKKKRSESYVLLKRKNHIK